MEDQSPALPQLPSKTIIAVIAAAFLLLAFAVYGSSLGNKFVAWDDTSLIYSQTVIKQISWANMKQAFSMYDPELYIPLTFFSYQIDYAISGLDPTVYHVTNLLLHTVSSLLVCWLVLPFVKRRWIAIVAGLIFLLHPINTEAVAWASARKDVLPTPFFLGAIIAYIYYSERRESTRGILYSLSLILFLLALFSKVVTLTLPFVLLLIDFLQHRRFTLKTLTEKMPFFALSTIFGIVALFGKELVVSSSTAWEKFLMAFKSIVFYLQKLFFPTNLSVIYPYPKPIVLSSPDFFIPILLVAALTVLATLSLKRTRVIAVCWTFFLLNLLPSFVNIAKGGDIYFASDRYTYVALIGIILLVAYALRSLEEDRGIGRWLKVGSAVCLAIFALASRAQSAVWADTQSLLSHAVSLYPASYPAHINLAIALREQGRFEEALQHVQQAQALHDSVDVHLNFAAISKRQGKIAEAEAEYRKAIAIDPKSATPYFGLGILFVENNRADDAVAAYNRALEIEPAFTAVYNNLAALELDRGNIARAEEVFRKAIAIRPPFVEGHYNLAIVLERQKKFTEAAAEYEAALTLDPGHVAAHVSLAGLYVKMGRNTDALEQLKIAKKLDPENEEAKALLQEMVRLGIVGRK